MIVTCRGDIEFKRYVAIALNELRRWKVNKLLGNELILQEIKTEKEHKIRFIDMKRMLPYGFWKAEKLDDKETKLTR